MNISTTNLTQEFLSMKELLTIVTRKGQITIPAEIRKSLGIKEGDKIALSVPKGQTSLVTLRPVRSVADMTFGAVAPRKLPEDFKKLRQLFVEGAAEEVMSETPPPKKP